MVQDNNFPALTEHRRDSGPLQAWPATVAFEKRVLCRGLELAVFFRSRFESLHPGKCVGKQVSPPLAVRLAVALFPVHVVSPPGAFVTPQFCQSQGRTRECPKTGAKTKPSYSLVSKNWDK